MWFLLLCAFGLIASGLNFLVFGYPKEINEIARILLLGQFIVTFGLVAIIGVVTNIFFTDTFTKKIKWPEGAFQIKYGFAQLCLGVMGVMAFWFQGNFWAATLINMYMYGLSGLWTHTQDMLNNKKIDRDNVSNIIMNIVYQIFITILSVLVGNVWVTIQS